MMDGPYRDTQGGFISPSLGPLTIDEMFVSLIEYMRSDTSGRYNVIIGTDSFLNSRTLFVSAVIIHRVGHGGRYFYKKTPIKKIENLRQRIFHETAMSIELASVIRTKLSENGFKRLPVEIHLDVGTNGETRKLIKDVVGMVTGSGYAAVTKPYSFGASKVADRHSK